MQRGVGEEEMVGYSGVLYPSLVVDTGVGQKCYSKGSFITQVFLRCPGRNKLVSEWVGAASMLLPLSLVWPAIREGDCTGSLPVGLPTCPPGSSLGSLAYCCLSSGCCCFSRACSSSSNQDSFLMADP